MNTDTANRKDTTMNATTARLAAMLAANAASAQPEDAEIVAGEMGLRPDQAVSNATAEATASEWAANHPYLCTGRGPTGRLRNFRAMGDDKLYATMQAVDAEDNDPEARAALEAEASSRR